MSKIIPLIGFASLLVFVIASLGITWAAIKKREKRRWGTAIISSILVFSVCMYFTEPSKAPARSAAASPVSTPAIAPITVPSPAVAPAPLPTVPSTPAAGVTQDSIMASLASGDAVKVINSFALAPDKVIKIEILKNVPEPGQNAVSIFYKPGSVWDETDFVKCAGGTAIFASSALFKNPAISRIVFFTQTEMTDQNGKSSMETVVKIDLNRAFANKVDWSGLADRHLTDPGNIYRIADYYKINAGVRSRVSAAEVKLK